MTKTQAARTALVAVVGACVVAACSLGHLLPGEGKNSVEIYRLAVLPLETAAGPEGGVPLPEDAARIVTAQIYAVLADQSRFVFVPDLDVAHVSAGLPRKAPLLARARALGEATGSDAVLCGSVSRFVERLGTPEEASRPAAVSFELQLVLSGTGEVVWRRSFAGEQKSAGAGLGRWKFWGKRPQWLSARELARRGAEQLLEQMADEVH